MQKRVLIIGLFLISVLLIAGCQEAVGGKINKNTPLKSASSCREYNLGDWVLGPDGKCYYLTHCYEVQSGSVLKRTYAKYVLLLAKDKCYSSTITIDRGTFLNARVIDPSEEMMVF